MSEHEELCPKATRELAEQRRRLTGGAYAHSALALDTIAHYQADKAAESPSA